MRLIIRSALLLFAGACVACSDEPPQAASDAPSERWQAPADSPYGFLREGGLGEDEMPAIWAGLPYESITLARSGCFGTCPAYEVALTRAVGIGPGHARYRGDAFVEREGSFEGSIDLWNYAQLCEMFDTLGFRELHANYSAEWTDDETIIIEVSHASGPYRVLDYGHQGPPELIALQLAIDATVAQVEWEVTPD